jgi:hypothetical protein
MGFTSYNSRPVVIQPTTQEIVALLTNVQKGAILNGFALNVRPKVLKYKEGIPFPVVVHLYKKLDEIEESARHLMRGEVIITPAVVDPETGEITIPAVYNTPPTNATILLNEIQDTFSDDFNAIQITAILTKMIEYSKWNGSGDWEYYSAEVIR